jgi:hypothetical protein
MAIRPGAGMSLARTIICSSIDIDWTLCVVIEEGDIRRVGDGGRHWW